MSDFFHYMADHDVSDIEGLMVFIEQFLDDPSIFFQMSEIERLQMEEKIDKALCPFRDNKDEL